VHAFSANAAPGSKPDGPNLEHVIDFGTYFGFIAKPLFLWLKWTHDHWVTNWGWAIMFLTVVINVALFPLRYVGMKSALKMQKVQPEINHIRSKYRGIKLNDPRMADQQREINEVMKREGVNQMAGCLPMLMQLPILVAFYTMLSVANELRHANWLWVNDLSSRDPLYILPVLITASMFLMQRITPMTGMDPAQAKMMQVMMPLMIGGISFTLPAGLGVYWVTGNLIGFVTQWFMNNTAHAKEVREHLAKRAEKKKKTRS
jgi:YidC/Oxa1 family membrane protein insertase